MIHRLLGLFAALSCFVATTVFAEEAPMPPRDQGLWQTVIMVGIALLFFYFILWRPEQKRRRETDDKRASMKKGDKVTAMGIIGTVHKVQENTVIVQMVDGSKIEFLKAAIADVVPVGEEEQPKSSS